MSADADVLVVGAGPAGSVAAALLARAGVRVRLVDRATFPRFKLCGDTLNPGGLALLRRLGLLTGDAGGLRVRGMTVTWHGSALRAAPAPAGKATAITGIYPDNLYGLAISRSRLDHALLNQAVAAGACFEPGVVVSDVLLETRDDRSAVVGVRIASPGPARELRAGVTIAADGRRSRLAFGLGVSRHPPRPRRWAIGAYMHGVSDPPVLGEMHIRAGGYIGVAPTPEGVVNVCVVASTPVEGLRDPKSFLLDSLDADPLLRNRFSGASLIAPPAVLGPLAIEPSGSPPDGLMLAGDAAGFIDPMTGDGLRFAIQGGELAAAAALGALEHGWSGVHEELARARARAFAAKWRFNRALRLLVTSPSAVRGVAVAARIAPALVRAIITHAGDCPLARTAVCRGVTEAGPVRAAR